MARTTKAEVESAFRIAMAAIDGDYNTDDVYSGYIQIDNEEGKKAYRACVGRYMLDNAACYGGYCIQQITNEQGGERHITPRMPAAQFVQAVRFMTELTYNAKRNA